MTTIDKIIMMFTPGGYDERTVRLRFIGQNILHFDYSFIENDIVSHLTLAHDGDNYDIILDNETFITISDNSNEMQIYSRGDCTGQMIWYFNVLNRNYIEAFIDLFEIIEEKGNLLGENEPILQPNKKYDLIRIVKRIKSKKL